GQYRMGIGAPETGNCHPAYSWDCHMPPLPGGPDIENPTRIVGAGYDSGCAAPPVLWGTERAALILNLQQTRHVQIACLDITDRSGCIELHCHAGNCAGEVLACPREQPPFGNWASNGIFAADADHVALSDIHIHGLAGRGIQAGRISDWRLERVQILANGWAGWDGDIGTDSSNHGRLEFEDVEIAHNGCAETWPGLKIGGCWAQGAGGYGDGLGTAETGGEWIFERAHIHHNTSDGLDLIYLDETASVVVHASLFEGNAGNQIKSAVSTLVSNSIVIANCAYFSAQTNFADWDHCRAAGDAIFLGLDPGVESRLINNSITGEGNCLVSSDGDRGGRILLANNLFVGQPSHSRDRPSCHFYSPQKNIDITWRANLVVNTHRGICAPDNLCPRSAGIRSTDVDNFDPTPLAGSPLIGAASVGDRLPGDFRGLPRPAGSPGTIGAIEATDSIEPVEPVGIGSRFRDRTRPHESGAIPDSDTGQPPP
ncbi:MAG: hypothetical protein LC637_13445, partial [Xanthomonadaceae bacterium]|nr:hypothetical protein [Xanthomonadaceae bacterium]